jgi:phosphoribosylformylglycinamidine synthase
LTKAGLLPSINKEQQEATLTYNDSNKFEARWVYLKVCPNKSMFIRNEDVSNIYLPVAHGEGKFITRDETILSRTKANHQVVFKYVNEHGEEAGYPWNPNGSIENIAGICDETGQILGMMPHPERHIKPTQHPRWTRNVPKEYGDGFLIFKNAVNYVKSNF